MKWYNARRPRLGQEFQPEVKAAIARIEQHPTGWQAIDGEIRGCQTNRFPYGVIYQVRSLDILILAVETGCNVLFGLASPVLSKTMKV